MAATETTLAKKVHIYSNGDRFFTGRRFVINPRRTRNYESFLTQVTSSLQPQFGAVRVLRTPENGHAVSDLEDLETGRSYVACAQKFIKLGYEDITLKPKPAPSPERRNKVVVSGRIRKIERTPIAIFVYTNGQPLQPARRILLKPWVHKTWETVLVAISEKVNLVTGAVRSIIDFASKDEVTEGVHLKNNEYYVAVGSERYKDMEYGQQPAVLSPKQQQKRRYPTLRPVKKKDRSGNVTDESQGSSPLQSSTTSTQSMNKKQEEVPSKSKKKAGQNTTNTEEGIPIKPIKHKRGSSDKAKDIEHREKVNDKPKEKPPPEKPKPAVEKPKEKGPEKKSQQPPVRQSQPATKKPNNKSTTIDLDKASSKKDEGGVFKAKGKKQKASEVREDKNVKEEVPIDKRKAEEVDDEQLDSPRNKEPLPPISKTKSKSEPQKKAPTKKQTAPKQTAKIASNKVDKKSKQKANSPEPTPEEEKAATTIQAGFRGYKTRKELKDKEDSATEEDNTPATENKDNRDEEKAAITIQANYRGYKARKDLKKTNSAEEKLTDEQAAVKIQANFRGYKARKDLKKNGIDDSRKSPDSASKRDAAATVIQAGYRGHLARKEVKALKAERESDEEKGEAEARAQSSQSKTNG